MEKILVKGDVYTVATKTECKVTSANGTPLGTATAEAPYTFPATTDRVVLSDPDAEFARVNPKYAPVKLRLLGLLGGGSSASALPNGYIAAEFLESTGTQYISTNWAPLAEVTDNLESGFKADHQVLSGSRAPLGLVYSNNALGLSSTFAGGAIDLYFGSRIRFYSSDTVKYDRMFVQLNYKNSRVLDINSPAFNKKQALTVQAISAPIRNPMPLFVNCTQDAGNYTPYTVCRIWSVEFTEGSSVVNSFVAAIDERGVPCMYDKVEKTPFYNKGSGSFIVGMTCEQALKLANLPSTGGTLTISLPSNWQEDEGVVNALATAEANGWVFTYQTYEADASTASTFALRRIFVRKTQNENGQYEDADGSRWHVEWCVGMIGAEPTDHGYEPFRSVDAAVAYWELEPWVDPEAENLLTEH